MNVGHHPPTRLRGVFREEQVVSFVTNSDSRANRDVLKERQDSIEAIVVNMASNGVSKESVNQICFYAIQCVYNESWGVGGSNNAVQSAIKQ